MAFSDMQVRGPAWWFEAFSSSSSRIFFLVGRCVVAEVCKMKRNPQFDLGAIKIQLEGEDIMQVLMQLLYFPVPVLTNWPANDLMTCSSPRKGSLPLPAASNKAAMRATKQLAIIQANGLEKSSST